METVEIFFSGGWVIRYEHFLKEEKGLMEEISGAEVQVLASTEKVEMAFVHDWSDGAKPLLLLCNHKDGSEWGYPEYDGFQYLWIFRTGEGDGGNPCFDLEACKDIPNIRYLKIDENVQKSADAQGIDWYEYWLELETVEVYSPEN